MVFSHTFHTYLKQGSFLHVYGRWVGVLQSNFIAPLETLLQSNIVFQPGIREIIYVQTGISLNSMTSDTQSTHNGLKDPFIFVV